MESEREDEQARGRWWDYFRRPFPSTEGFSAYRMPGFLVHLPVLGMCLLGGLFLCGRHRVLMPFLPMYAVIGLYGGRDIAILAHYAPPLTIMVWLASLAFIVLAPRGVRFLVSHPALNLIVGAAGSIVLLGFFVWHVRRWLRGGYF